MDHREMYRKVEFTFDDEYRREYISGSVELTEKACIDMEYKVADKFQKITGDLRWFINGLAIVMQDYNEGILKENGNQFIEIRYFDEDLKEKKYYCGFINDFSDYGSDNVAFRSIRMLYRFVKDLIEETKFQSLKGVSVEGFIMKSNLIVDTTKEETVCLLSKLHEAKHHVSVKLDMDEMDLTSAESKATYEEIKKYVLSIMMG